LGSVGRGSILNKNNGRAATAHHIDIGEKGIIA